MTNMNAKTIDPKIIAHLSRYTEEELDPRFAEDQAGMEAYVERNREAINKALEEGYVSLDAGEGVDIRSLEDLLSVFSRAKARYGTKTK